MKRQCKECRHYEKEPFAYHGEGYCKRFPPTPQHLPMVDSLAVFPRVPETQWCGEFAGMEQETKPTPEGGGRNNRKKR